MKNNMVLKKALRVVSFLVPFFTIACVEAREMGVKGNTQSISQRRTKSSRRTQPRYKGAQRQRSTQGRNAVRTRQQPAQQPPVERIIPTETPQTKVVPANQPAVQASPQLVPTKVDVNAAAWVRIQTWLLSEEISPSQALNVVKMLRRINLSHEQEDWLNRFELQAREDKSRELVSASSINRPHQQTTLPQQPTIPAADGLSSVPKPQLIPVGGEIDEKKWQEIITLLNKYAQSPSQSLVEYIKKMQSDDRFSDEQREFLRQYQQRMEVAVASRKLTEPSTGVIPAVQPNKTFLGFPVSNAPASRPGKLATKEGWQQLQDDLLREAKTPSPALLHRIEEIKKYPHFNDQQKEWLAGFQEKIEAPLQEAWLMRKADLVELARENPSPALLDAVEQIKREKYLNNDQLKWLGELQQEIKASLQQQADLKKENSNEK